MFSPEGENILVRTSRLIHVIIVALVIVLLIFNSCLFCELFLNTVKEEPILLKLFKALIGPPFVLFLLTPFSLQCCKPHASSVDSLKLHTCPRSCSSDIFRHAVRYTSQSVHSLIKSFHFLRPFLIAFLCPTGATELVFILMWRNKHAWAIRSAAQTVRRLFIGWEPGLRSRRHKSSHRHWGRFGLSRWSWRGRGRRRGPE
jgi:hypothetical protein